MKDFSLDNKNLLNILTQIEIKLQLLSPPESNPGMSFTEIGNMLHKYYEDTKEEHLEIATQLQKILEEISELYIKKNKKERSFIRDELRNLENISSMMESLPHKISSELKTEKDTKAFRLGLLIASMQDQAIDSRDWSLSVGALIGSAKSAGIDFIPIIKEVAEISDSENRKGRLWTTRDAFLKFIN